MMAIKGASGNRARPRATSGHQTDHVYIVTCPHLTANRQQLFSYTSSSYDCTAITITYPPSMQKPTPRHA